MEFTPAKPWQITSNAITAVLDSSWKTHRDADPPRKYLGGSMIGRDCEREIAYQYHKTPIEPVMRNGVETLGFSGQLYRIFDRGHKGEDRVAEYLRVAGFDLVTHRKDGGQFGWSAMDGLIKGHIDGVILDGPKNVGIDYTKPLLWENKILNNATFGKLWNHGLKKTKTVYYVQVNLYMAYMELEQCLFTAENADNCEIYSEVLSIDTQVAQEMSDRGVRIVRSREPEDLPRVAGSSDDYRCKECWFAKRCWTQGATNTTPVPAPSWLTKPTDN